MFVLLLMALNAIVLEVIVAQDLESPSPYSTSNPFPTPYLVQHELKHTSSPFKPKLFLLKKRRTFFNDLFIGYYASILNLLHIAMEEIIDN